MSEITLGTLHRGCLLVKIKALGEFLVSYPSPISSNLWDYVCLAYTMLSGTKKRVIMQANEWKILNFSPGESILEVEKIAQLGFVKINAKTGDKANNHAV